ncbi:uncharacterized protein EAF02_010435 [Botrytis sinoallii]|uniref:uncharacterized protein n=1 Tax=Botrytis sinoallii TaxID=1463999 RepID=UPI001902B122|nr:uncharacterized protein EAF02_010435 [Botrytis sinoallii]KAF7862886.1 hypothetical protein EAF02_010435 [Botrytis sinoallii]
MARRTAEHEDKRRYERDRKLQGTSNTSKAGKQHAPVSQAYDSPAPTYPGQQYTPPRWPGPQAPDPYQHYLPIHVHFFGRSFLTISLLYQQYHPIPFPIYFLGRSSDHIVF